jgi:hypothetical protein
MSALPRRSSLLPLGFALWAASAGASAAAATPADGPRGEHASLAEEGLLLLRHVLHIQAKPEEVLSYTISVGPREASLELDLASGRSRTIAFRSGEILVDGQASGQYVPGSRLDRAWRQLLAGSASLDTRAVLAALRTWDVPGLAGDELAAKRRLDAVLRDLASPAPGAPAAAAAPETPAPEVVPVPEATAPAPEAPAPPAAPGAVDILFHDVRNVVALFIALAMIGFGTVFFARRNVEVVADTAANAFGRALVVGLLAQLLLLPTLAMLIVGLVFTIVGILLLPFAVLAYVIAACVAALGGYLAVAHAIGETVTRRRMANGVFVRYPNAYGYLFTGLVGLLGLWAAAALFGWAGPVVFVFRAAAFIVTWLAGTVGFGAVLLSRAGLRETFAGRHAGELSDEYLWATPPATPTAPRQGRDRGRTG